MIGTEGEEREERVDSRHDTKSEKRANEEAIEQHGEILFESRSGKQGEIDALLGKITGTVEARRSDAGDQKDEVKDERAPHVGRNIGVGTTNRIATEPYGHSGDKREDKHREAIVWPQTASVFEEDASEAVELEKVIVIHSKEIRLFEQFFDKLFVVEDGVEKRFDADLRFLVAGIDADIETSARKLFGEECVGVGQSIIFEKEVS